MAGYEGLPKRTIACATCDNWDADKRFPSRNRQEVLYETYQKGKCFGMQFMGEWTTPRFRCKNWKVWRKMQTKPKMSSHFVTEEAQKAREADASDLEHQIDKIDQEALRRSD